MDFTKTQTYKNLQEAFSGESQASMRYAIFAEKAKQEGHAELEKFFLEASQEEKGHATLWYSLFNGGQVPTSKENVKKAIEYENEEWTNSYEAMAKTAREEGFEDIAKHFEQVASEEEEHEGELHSFLEKLN